MLSSLRIRNLALVEELEWNPGPGFVAITGETGAGKSIILGALKLLLGERADKSLIRSGADTCMVEAEFRIPAELQLNPLLIEQGIEPCTDGVLILKRTISTTDPGRQFINNCATTLSSLKWVGDALVDLHGPHDHQSLFSTERQLELLDAFAGSVSERKTHSATFNRLKELESARSELGGSDGAIEREIDLLRYQLQEIRSFPLPPNKEALLLADYHRASNARRLAELATAAVNALDEGDESLLIRLASARRPLADLEKLDPSTASFAEIHRSATVELEELASLLRRYAESIDFDPASVELLEDQVNLLESIKRKYGGSLKAALEFANRAEEKLARLEGREVELERINKEIATLSEQLAATSTSLTAKRQAAAPKLAKAVIEHLTDLGFKKTGFEIRLTPSTTPKGSGADEIEFLFSPNPGEPLRPLRAIASSGEISRVMLSLKTALAGEDNITLMVFDEIDANVGGEIAHAVALKMRYIGRTHQVLVITHLPQVASKADAHFKVSKEVYGSGNFVRTQSRLEAVTGEERVRELARMLGGQSAAALDHARELLADSSLL